MMSLGAACNTTGAGGVIVILGSLIFLLALVWILLKQL